MAFLIMWPQCLKGQRLQTTTVRTSTATICGMQPVEDIISSGMWTQGYEGVCCAQGQICSHLLNCVHMWHANVLTLDLINTVFLWRQHDVICGSDTPVGLFLSFFLPGCPLCWADCPRWCAGSKRWAGCWRSWGGLQSGRRLGFSLSSSWRCLRIWSHGSSVCLSCVWPSRYTKHLRPHFTRKIAGNRHTLLDRCYIKW